MKNIIDYVEHEFRTFEQKPFSEVDSLVLSQFCYIEFESVYPKIGSTFVKLHAALKAEEFENLFLNVRDEESNKRLLFAMAASPRFRDILAGNFINKINAESEMQFSATTFILPNKVAYIAFRGTDATLVGWKEDMNMAFSAPVPSQLEAEKYLTQILKTIPSDIILGGHSKGGNLAVYAGMTASENIRSRITKIYDHDGPGFIEELLHKNNYDEISNKIVKSVPEAAFIGLLLENKTDYKVVKSKSLGIMQHDPFSWELYGDNFKYTDRIFRISDHFNRSLEKWLESIDKEQRKLFVDTLYSIISIGEAETINDLAKNWIKNIPKAFEKTMDLDPDTRRFVSDTLRELAISPVKF